MEVQCGGAEASRLQAIPLFSDLGGDLIAALAQRLLVERFAAGDVVVNAGDPGDKLCLIITGEVEVLSPDSAETQRTLAILRLGDFLGETGLLNGVPRTATIRARRPVQRCDARAHTDRVRTSAGCSILEWDRAAGVDTPAGERPFAEAARAGSGKNVA